MAHPVDTSERIAAEAVAVAAIAEECIAGKSPISTWHRRVTAALGMVGTRLPVLDFGRRPKFFTDLEVRERLVELHREVTIAEAHDDCRSRFGETRTPSRSAVARFWRYLDRLQGRDRPRRTPQKETA